MLLTYIDEIGSRTEYVSKDHPKYNTSPALVTRDLLFPMIRLVNLERTL